MSDRLIIFDTTLRDGEQSPGASMTKDEKVRIARALERMHVDVIEAGFPIASPGDFESVKQIAQTVRGSTICGLARCSEKDIDAAWEAVKHAPQARIHVFLATSAKYLGVPEIPDSLAAVCSEFDSGDARQHADAPCYHSCVQVIQQEGRI